jgi:hypothetical protein
MAGWSTACFRSASLDGAQEVRSSAMAARRTRKVNPGLPGFIGSGMSNISCSSAGSAGSMGFTGPSGFRSGRSSPSSFTQVRWLYLTLYEPPMIFKEARPLKIVIPPRAGHFSTLRLLASLQRRKLASLRSADSSNSALRAQTVVFAGATLRGQGTPKNLQCTLPGSRFSSGAKVSKRWWVSKHTGQEKTNAEAEC